MFSETIEKALRVMLALSIPAAAVMAAGLRPLLQVAFHFDEAGTALLTMAARVYLLTLIGYVMQETLARAFYARQEPLMPLYGVLARLAIYLTVGLAGVTLFRSIGVPVIASGEMAVLVEAILLLTWLNRRISPPVQVLTAAGKGLIAAIFSGLLAYALAVYLPGPAYITALIGMASGTILALFIVRSETRLLFRL